MPDEIAPSKLPESIRDNLCAFDGKRYIKVPAIEACRGCAQHYAHSGYANPSCYQVLDCNMSHTGTKKPYILIHPTEQAMVNYLTERLS